MKPLDGHAELADATTRNLCGYLNALADLGHPKTALAVLNDGPRLKVFEQSMQQALQEQPGAWFAIQVVTL